MTQLEELVMMVAERDTATAKNEILSAAISYNTLAVKADELAAKLAQTSKKFSEMAEELLKLKNEVTEKNPKQACKVAFAATEYIHSLNEMWISKGNMDRELQFLSDFDTACNVDIFAVNSERALEAGDAALPEDE
jgi:hypothetical protein